MKKFKTEFSKEELHNALNSHSGEAKEIIEDKDKWEKFKIKFEDFLKKAEKIPVLGGVIDDVTCMVLRVDSYIKKSIIYMKQNPERSRDSSMKRIYGCSSVTLK